MELPINQIICGDCVEVMRGFPDESIDLVATDSPYGYSFMGKDWDKAVPPVEVWKECLRVLKSGAFMFVMSAPRQDVLSQMIIRIGQTGFETGFTSIYWAYASGFPKAMNISKAVDKKLGAKREVLGISPNWRESKRNREQFGSMEVRGENAGLELGPAVTEQAKALDGSYGGFQPKPAVEVVIVCMKPLCEKTFVDQALANGKGVTWLDDARIPFEENPTGVYGTSNKTCTPTFNASVDQHDFRSSPHEMGRFPANLLVSDDALNDGRIIKTTYVKSTYQQNREDEFLGELGHSGNQGYNDSGSFSRFFDLDKWFDKTVQNLPESVRRTFPFLICPKASKGERNQGLENMPEKERSYMSNANGTAETWHPIDDNTGKQRDRFKIVSHNIHPTVKPLKLMSYLVTLGSRPRNVVLDPFCGSGTTCLASKILDRQWIGIDISLEYVEIAQKRLATIPEQLSSFLRLT